VRSRAWWRACRSTARRRYSSPPVAARGRGGRGGRGGAGGAHTGDGAVVKQPGDGGEAAVMKVCGGGSSSAREQERREVWGAAR
jgi:hypothetical protein